MTLSKKVFLIVVNAAIFSSLCVLYFTFLVTGNFSQTLVLAGILIICVLVIFLSIYFLLKDMLFPIGRLVQVVRESSNSLVDKRVPISSNDEIGQLEAAFNEVISKLQSERKDFGNVVSEKMIELAAKVEESEREKRRDEAILGSIGDGLMAVDESGKILKINEVACYLLNLNRDKVVGQVTTDTFQIFNLDDTPISPGDRAVETALRDHVKTIRVAVFKPPEGKKLILTMIATPIVDNDKIIGAIEIIRDTTREREVDRMKTEFISLASHQLRTPLSAIKWFSEMLLNGDAGILNPEQNEYTQNISDSTQRMIQLVNSLLNISRIESGRILVDPKLTDLHELVRGVVNDLKAKIEERQQKLVISIHEGLPKINVDPRLIRQVYMNLLTNAIKYTAKGGEITVFISSKGNEVISQVSDNGYGIPKSQQNKVFQKFFRAENVVKVETDGTGLGLYLIKAIVESSMGKIWFESEEGKGTSFWFTLPLSGTPAKFGEVTLDG